MQGKMDRDEWYSIVLGSLKEIFLDDAPSTEEMARRKNLYGDPRVSTIIRDYLSRFVGVISFSADPLIPTMWAHYARNSGFVVGYNTGAMTVSKAEAAQERSEETRSFVRRVKAATRRRR